MTILSDLLERARHARDCGNFDSLHGELLDQVEFLEHEFEAERDRAAEHFDARMDAEAKLRLIEDLCKRPFDVLQVEHIEGEVDDVEVVTVAAIRAATT